MSMTTTDTTTETQAAAERCGQCGAPAAHEQRYCLNCGFHRRNAPDPVARYLSEASAARAQVAAATAAAARRRRLPRFGARVVALLVALALVVGILIGNATAGNSNAGSRTASHGTTPASHKTTQHGGSQVKNETGSSYVHQEENLPNSVSP